MTRRRKKEELDPAQALVLLLIIVSFVGTYQLTKSIIASFIAAGSILGLYISIIFFINQKRTERLKQ